MRPFLLLALLTLSACAPKAAEPGAGSGHDSGLTMADVYRAASVAQQASDCTDPDFHCRFFTQIPPEVLRSRLNLAPFTPKNDGLLNMAGAFHLEVTPSSADYYAVSVNADTAGIQ